MGGGRPPQWLSRFPDEVGVPTAAKAKPAVWRCQMKMGLSGLA